MPRVQCNGPKIRLICFSQFDSFSGFISEVEDRTSALAGCMAMQELPLALLQPWHDPLLVS